MKQTFLFFLTSLLSCSCYGQANPNKWFSWEASMTNDFLKNTRGGISTDFTYMGLEAINMTIDLGKAKVLKETELFLHGLHTHGGSASSDIIGDFQVASNIENGNYTGLYEYYISHTVGHFNFIFGQHDLNSEFDVTEYGGVFINSSFGVAPNISVNVPVSIYPFAAPALVAKYIKEDKYAVRLGVYDGDPGDPETNLYNMQPRFSQAEGLLYIGEFELSRPINGLPQSYKIGGYYHTSDFNSYNDTLINQSGNYGIYGVSDIVLWSNADTPESYLGLFLQGGFAPQNLNQVSYYFGGGFHLNSIFTKKIPDALGLAFAYANVSTPFRELNAITKKGEAIVELTYQIQLFEFLSIQPDLQYIVNPGVDSSLDNALLGILRAHIFFQN